MPDKATEKMTWIRHQMAEGTLLHFNAEDVIAISIEKVEIYDEHRDGINHQHLIANGNQILDITDVEIYGYNPRYDNLAGNIRSEEAYKLLLAKRYPIYPDTQKYIPAITLEGEFNEDINRLLQRV